MAKERTTKAGGMTLPPRRDPPDAKRIFTREPLRALARLWAERADAINLTGKARDEGCLTFFLGAAALADDLYGIDHPLTVKLLKTTMYVISLRGEAGLTEFLAKD